VSVRRFYLDQREIMRIASETMLGWHMPDPHDRQLSTIERAYQLARSGTCRSMDDIRRRLTAERYESVQAHLAGSSIKRDLIALCKVAAADR